MEKLSKTVQDAIRKHYSDRGRAGGKARARSMTKAQLTEIAMLGVKARAKKRNGK